MTDPTLLLRADAYFDAAPRAAARAEAIGPFTLFVRRGPGWPYYARPTPASAVFTADDVEAVRARQRDLGLPEAFEWIGELVPDLELLLTDRGLRVHRHPLMVRPVASRDANRRPQSPPGIDLRACTPQDDPALFDAVAQVAFENEGTDIGPAGPGEVSRVQADSGRGPQEETGEGEAACDPVAHGPWAAGDPGGGPCGDEIGTADLLRSGAHLRVAAWDGPDMVAVATAIPVGRWAEIAGVGTLPDHRRRGIGGAMTADLIARCARLGVRTAVLSAADGAVAAIYARQGFTRVGTACIAEPAD